MTASLDINRITETFALLPDWEHRYQFLDELGEKLPPMNQDDQIIENQVIQCMSDVWVKARKREDDTGLIDFDGDCNTSTIKGVVAVIITLFSGKTAAEIQQTDIDDVFRQLQLFEHLSPNRHVGVYAIVEKMKSQAAALG